MFPTLSMTHKRKKAGFDSTRVNAYVRTVLEVEESMADALSIVGAAIKTVQKLREVAQKVRDAPTQNLIADLTMTLADLKLQIADLQETNLRLQGEIKSLKEQSSFRDKLEIRGSLYYFKVPEQNRPLGPYCTRCYDVEQKLVLATPVPDEFRVFGKFTCPNCKAYF